MNPELQTYLNNLREKIGLPAYCVYNWHANINCIIIRWYEERRDGSRIKDVRHTDVAEFRCPYFLDKLGILFEHLKLCKDFKLTEQQVFDIFDDIKDLQKNNVITGSHNDTA